MKCPCSSVSPLLLLLIIIIATLVDNLVSAGYNVGVGRADITGPAAEIGMMGYAKQGQNTRGIHTRNFARAFIVEDVETETRVVFVSCDTAMMGQLVKLGVLAESEAVYSGMYSEKNLVLSATHTHSGPAGFRQSTLGCTRRRTSCSLP